MPIRAALPGTGSFGEMHGDAGFLSEHLMPSHFHSLVPGQGSLQRLRQLGECSNDGGIGACRGVVMGQIDDDSKLGFPFLRVTLAETHPTPVTRSPFQWPTPVRDSTSAGRWSIMVMSRIREPDPVGHRVLRILFLCVACWRSAYVVLGSQAVAVSGR